uniref:Uncharacterized protein n=1 Tax=Vannella robusta TaxID=1487602 RepID=A0A7S4MT78_9EUKA|mmetsp:Transcript_9694/g.11992  ORF Transcript_9694/g.11992 Transcript_9694/m.11992 type:complete len:280 (+) Transcript_9694:3-842(+)
MMHIEAASWSHFAQALDDQITRIRASSNGVDRDSAGNSSSAPDKDLCRFTCFPLADDFQLVTCKYCHSSTALQNFSHHYDICPSNPANKEKYPTGLPVTRNLIVPPAQIQNGRKNNKSIQGEKRKIRKKTVKRRRRKSLSVSEILSGIVGTLPGIAEEPEEDHKILIAAHHVSNYNPTPLASPKYVRKNSIRPSIARLPCRTGSTVQESPLPLVVKDKMFMAKPDARILSPEIVKQAHNQAAARELLKRRLQASSPRKLFFSISPSKAQGSSPLSACRP